MTLTADHRTGDPVLDTYNEHSRGRNIVSAYYASFGGNAALHTSHYLHPVGKHKVGIDFVPEAAREGLAIFLKEAGITFDRGDEGAYFHFHREGLTPQKLETLFEFLKRNIKANTAFTAEEMYNIGQAAQALNDIRRNPAGGEKDPKKALEAFRQLLKSETGLPEALSTQFERAVSTALQAMGGQERS